MKNRCYKVILVLLVCVLALSVSATVTKAASGVRLPWMDGKTIWPVGVNLAWYNWDQDFLDNGWDSRFAAIKSQFDTMASQGVRAVRWWVFPDGNNAPLWSGTGEGSTCTGLPTNFITHMVQMTDYALSKNIKIYYCFTSFDWGYNTHSWNHDDIIDNPTIRQSFLDNAVKPILQALGTHEGVMGWDVINEPEWLISSADGGDPNSSCEYFSLATMRAFVKAVVDCVHANAKQPVSVGSASMKWCGAQYQFWTGLGLDFYDFHWWDWATPYFNPFTTAPADLGLDKPCIIGEMMYNPQGALVGLTHQQCLENLYNNGYSGYFPWAWNDSANDCKPYIHPSFVNFESAHPDVNQILGGGTPTPTRRAATPTPTQRVTPTPTRRAATPTPTQRVTPTPTRRAATPTPTRRVTPTPTTRNTPTPTQGTGGFMVSYVIQSDWGNGATIGVTITNNTTTTVNGWTLAFSFPGNQTITNLWNGTYTQSGASVSVKDAGYNATIGANGGNVNFGFNISYSGTNLKPTSFTLNGTTCQAQ
ncbi:MAG: cellulose binding domain-containing protein [Firmicutes bacterium]|nr:cellulose binding domain-containing protein [Bacillota bacterium]